VAATVASTADRSVGAMVVDASAMVTAEADSGRRPFRGWRRGRLLRGRGRRLGAVSSPYEGSGALWTIPAFAEERLWYPLLRHRHHPHICIGVR